MHSAPRMQGIAFMHTYALLALDAAADDTPRYLSVKKPPASTP